MAHPRSQPWAVLGLDPSWFPELSGASSFASSASSASPASADDATRSALIRRAYRRALLQHHPDKQTAGSQGGSTAFEYTVDEIRSAYAALGGGGQSAAKKAVLGGLATGSTATGLEIVDLDELPFDEAEDDGASVQTWYRSCRCGNPRGFTLNEHDLEEELDAEAMETLAGDAGSGRSEPAVGELMVGCQDCSLWLCVHFAAAPDEEDEEDGEDDD